MSSKTPWYLGERAQALAYVYLTRRDDLRIQAPHHDTHGIDLLVELLRSGRSSGRVFGVQLTAQVAPLLHPGARIPQPAEIAVDTFPFPICLFFFTMQDNAGYYTWIAEPLIAESGQPRLRSGAGEPLATLDTSALEQIVARVQVWYDALAGELAA